MSSVLFLWRGEVLPLIIFKVGDDAKFAMMENKNSIASANFGENGILIFEKKIL